MRVAVEELEHQLKTVGAKLPQIILFNGNEPLLVEEALDCARALYKQAGFSERIKYQLETGFDWSELLGAGQSMSLFAEKRMLELRVPKSLGTAGTKAIAEYCENLPEDDVLFLIMPGLDKRQRSAKWCKAVDFAGWLVDIVDVSLAQFPYWLKRRLQSRSLRVEAGVVELMSQQLEGNVLAAAQEVDKLQVLASDGAVTLKLVQESLADQARFDVYALSDAVLAGEFPRVLRIKQRLVSEGVEPVIVVWALVREIRTLSAISHELSRGQNRGQLFREHRIWSKRESGFNSALNRLNSSQWRSLLSQASHLDQSVKGQRHIDVGDVWHQIEAFCAQACAMALPTARAVH